MSETPTIVAGHAMLMGSAGVACGRCGRRLNDLLGYAEIARIGDEGLACSGQLTGAELASLLDARKRQLEVFA